MPKAFTYILFALYALLLSGFSGPAEARSRGYMRTSGKDVELKKAVFPAISSVQESPSEDIQSIENPPGHRHSGRISAKHQLRAPELLISGSAASVLTSLAAEPVSIDAQAAGYRERSFGYYALLIYPHHGFW